MRARDASGFVLVLVLAMLVVLSLLAGGIAATTARLRDHAEDRQRDLQDQVDMASTKATLYYLLSTQPMTIGGLTVDNRFAAIRARAEAEGLDFNFSVAPTRNEIALDGRVYRGLGDTRFAVQDDSGLFGIKLQPPEALARLIQGGLMDASFWIAEADNPPQRLAAALDSLDLMLRGLLQVPQAR